MQSIFIEAKEWFDKTAGNSYFSARIEIDGEEVARLPFQYGYETFYQQMALAWLIKNDFVDSEIRSLHNLREWGIAVYTTKSKALLRDVKAWGKNA